VTSSPVSKPDKVGFILPVRHLRLTAAGRCGSRNPVFRATRAPVHLIADLVAQSANPPELMDGYPGFTARDDSAGAGLWPSFTHSARHAASYRGAISRRCDAAADSSRPSQCRKISDRQLTFRHYGEISS
jgi:hypothetical protein